MEKLNDQDVLTYLIDLEGWKWDDVKWIHKKYRFKQYLTGISFVNEVANFAEHRNHHPFISIDYKLITIKLSSWHAGGLTALDMEMARMIDEIYDQFLD